MIDHNTEIPDIHKEQDGLPFSGLEKKNIWGFIGDVYTHPEMPGKIIRWFRHKMLLSPSDEPTIQAVDKFAREKSVFKDLENYGLHVAHSEYFIAKRNNQPAAFAAVDFIQGENLAQKMDFDKRAVDEIDKLFAGLVKHTLNAYQNSSMSWADFKLDNIVYGKGRKDNEPLAYIVDTEPVVWDFGSIKNEKKEVSFWELMMDINRGAYTISQRSKLFDPSGFKRLSDSLKTVRELSEPKDSEDAKNFFKRSKEYCDKILGK